MFVDPYNIARKLNKKLKFFENFVFFENFHLWVWRRELFFARKQTNSHFLTKNVLFGPFLNF